MVLWNKSFSDTNGLDVGLSGHTARMTSARTVQAMFRILRLANNFFACVSGALKVLLYWWSSPARTQGAPPRLSR